MRETGTGRQVAQFHERLMMMMMMMTMMMMMMISVSIISGSAHAWDTKYVYRIE
jgi:hypothetical protein